MSLYRYSVYEDTPYERAYKVDTICKYDHDSDYDLECLAQELASDFYSNHDGWEQFNRDSEIRFYVWIDEDTIVEFDVQIEFEPSFTAYRMYDGD